MVMRRFAWVAGIAALALCLGAAYGAYVLAGYSWDQVVSYESPYADYDRQAYLETVEPAAAETSETPRVVMILIDGLTLEASRSYMTALNTVRQYGADMVAVTPQPSLSYPTWTNVVSGAPPEISGVTTNWFEGQVPVQTLFDVLSSRRCVVSATEDFQDLYDVRSVAADTYLEPWDNTRYLSEILVDQALVMAKEGSPALTFVYLPDADEIAHTFGPESSEYQEVVTRIDRDLSRLIDGMQDGRTLFVVTADHGHVRGGGHGGFEPEATRVPAVFFGPGTRFEQGDISQSDIAPTVVAFLGADIPAQAVGRVRDAIVNVAPETMEGAQRSYRDFAAQRAAALNGSTTAIGEAESYDAVDVALQDVRAAKAEKDRAERLPTALVAAGAAFLALVLVVAASWRAGIAAGAGVLVYYAVYNGLYFLVHGHQWSLAAFNTESYVEGFFNLRMIEAAVAALLATAVAALVYPLLRREPKGPRGTYLGGWLSLGPATVLAIQATLVMQVAWFIWAYGADVTWQLPDFTWAFKYDLDLIQVTALGAAALLAPIVTYVVGRYHPKVRNTRQ